MGAIIGAVIAGGIALATSAQNSSKASKAKKAAQEYQEKLQAEYEQLQKDVAAHYDKTDKDPSTYANEQDYANYLEALRNMDTNMDIFRQQGLIDEDGNMVVEKYDKDVSDFMDERRDYLTALAGRKALASAAGGGMGRSYDGARAFGDAVVAKDEELYKNALAARAQDYSEWNDYLANKQKQLDMILNGQANDLSNQKTLADLYRQDQQDEWEDMMNVRLAALNAGMQAQNMVNNTGNYTYDVGGTVNAMGAGANLGDKVGQYWAGGTTGAKA